MGGIKNKLNNKLSNKTLSKVPLWLKGDVRRKSGRGIVSGVNPLGSRLPSFSQPSEMLTRNILNTRTSNWWSLHASKTIGSLRLVTLTKYLSIACFTLVLISTIGLNLYRTYSNDNIETSAVGNSSSGGELATQADIDPTSISLSITSSPSSSTGGNDANLSLSIPQGGGIATGRHTVKVETGSSVIGYDLMLSSDSEETSLVNSDNVDNEGNDSGSIIPTTTGILTSPSQLADKSYGYTLANLDNDSSLANTDIWIGLKPNTNPDTIATVDDSNLTVGQASTTSHNIYYGVNIQNPVGTRAGDYTRQVVYTVVGELMPEPTIDDLVLNSSWTDDTPDTAYGSTSILTGQNLNYVIDVYVDLNDNETKDGGEEVANLAHGTGDEASTKLTFTAPTYTQEGQKNVYLEWGGGEPIEIKNGWNYIEPSTCISNINGILASIGLNGGDCYVDIDDNMIPVYYTGDEQNPEWTLVQVGSDIGKWYNYGEGRWANAVTLRDDYENGAYCYDPSDQYGYTRINAAGDCPTGYSKYTPLAFMKAAMTKLFLDGNGPITNIPLNPDDILGYWVYIPRYSYEVMRRDAIDLVQQPEDFKIKFETAGTAKKIPTEGCSSTDDPKSYRVGCGLTRTYTNTATDTAANTVTGATWATHPAFTWMDADGNPVELNGIWVGKFETTGSTEAPTVLPNETALSSIYAEDKAVCYFYDVAKSIGYPDPLNVYGCNNRASTQSAHDLYEASSHMAKDSEWSAMVYLSASRYGAGVNKVQVRQTSYASSTGLGPNDGPYNSTDGQLSSTTNNTHGIYDVAGGRSDVIMGSYTTVPGESSGDGFLYPAKPPYVDLYPDSLLGNDFIINDVDFCNWDVCGGRSLHEVTYLQSNYGYVNDVYWGTTEPSITGSIVSPGRPWSTRGGLDAFLERSSTFSITPTNASNVSGMATNKYSFRVTLIAK